MTTIKKISNDFELIYLPNKKLKSSSVSKPDLFNGCIDKLNNRFVLTEELFSKAIESLIEQDYINKCADKFVYVP